MRKAMSKKRIREFMRPHKQRNSGHTVKKGW